MVFVYILYVLMNKKRLFRENIPKMILFNVFIHINIPYRDNNFKIIR